MVGLRSQLPVVAPAVIVVLIALVTGCNGFYPSPNTPYAGVAPDDSPRSSTIYPYTNIGYTLPSRSYSSFQMAVKFETLPDPYAPYWAQFWVYYENGAQVVMRFGTSTNYIGGRGANVFVSRAGAAGTIACPAVVQRVGVESCCPPAYSSGGIGCFTSLPWLTGHAYTLFVSLKSKTASIETWRAYIIDSMTKRMTMAGTWTVPRSWGLLQPTSKLPFGAQLGGGPIWSCEKQPYARAILSNPIAVSTSGSKVAASIAGVGPGPCKSNAKTTASPGDKQSDIQMGYSWRPGATPSPRPTPPVGQPLFTPLPMPIGGEQHASDGVKVGAEQSVIPGAEFALWNLPDEAVSALRFSGGLTRMWIASGSLSGVGGDATFLLQTRETGMNGLVPAPVAEPYAVPRFTTFDPGSEQFDANYNGPGTVTPAANGHDLLMIYHGENHVWNGLDYSVDPAASGVGPFYCTAGLARSSDDGFTWAREGAIITGASAKQGTAANGGACNPSVIAVGGYLYAFYIEAGTGSTGLARSPLNSDGAPGTWLKYYNGSFSTDALHPGPFTGINTGGAGGEPNVTFNRYLNAFVLLFPYPNNGQYGISMQTSEDLINWSTPKLLISTTGPACELPQLPACYPSLVSPAESSSQITGQTGYVYVTHAVNGVRGMYRYPYAIGNAQLP